MAVWPRMQRFGIFLDEMLLDDSTFSGKSVAINEFLKSKGHHGYELGNPQKRVQLWDYYKAKGFRCITVNERGLPLNLTDLTVEVPVLDVAVEDTPIVQEDSVQEDIVQEDIVQEDIDKVNTTKQGRKNR